VHRVSKKKQSQATSAPEELRKRLVNEGANPLKIQAQVEAHYAKGKASRKQKQTKARAERYEAQYQRYAQRHRRTIAENQRASTLRQTLASKPDERHREA
jgi:hypothetical protein